MIFLGSAHKLEYSRNIPGYSISNLGHTHVLLLWNMGYSKKYLGHTQLHFFGITWNIGIFHFQFWDIPISENLGYKTFWNIPKKMHGTYQNCQKMEYPGFLEYSGIFRFLILGHRGGRVKFNQVNL